MINVEKNSFGKIEINKEIIENIIEEAVLNQESSVFLATSKGRISPKFKAGNSPSASVRYKDDKGVISIKIYLAFTFGNSLKWVTNKLKEELAFSLGEILGNKKIKLIFRIKSIVHKGQVKRGTNLEIIFEIGE